jgi:rubrerythrin
MSELKASLEALKLALKTEEEGYKLYKFGADQAKSEFVKTIFTQLFKDEFMHTDLIKRFYAHINKSNDWSELTKEEKDYKGLKGEIKTIFTTALKNTSESEKNFSESDKEVYKRAIEFEKNGVKMYTKFYNDTHDEKAKKFYSFLRDMEQEHWDVLDDTYQYLNDPDGYYLRKEGWTLDY